MAAVTVSSFRKPRAVANSAATVRGGTAQQP